MSVVNISDITVLNNPTRFTDSYNIKITFECLVPLEDDIEWKLIYVGSADSADKDQELDSCLVGPVPVGLNSFAFEAASPDPARIPSSELVGVTVILLTAAYKDREFVRVGYYVNTEYDAQYPELRALYGDDVTEEMVKRRPDPPLVDKLVRNVLTTKPRVTRFKITWDTPLLNQATAQAPLSAPTAATFQPMPMDSPAVGMPHMGNAPYPAPAAFSTAQMQV